MEELFRKFCVFYATDGQEDILKQLNEEAKDNAETYQKKAIKFVKNLRHKSNKLGYGIDFDSFCNLLEEYITKKDDLEDKEKRTYLKILFSMSQLYEVNLRSELEKYVSYKKVTTKQITERDVFKQFCLYNLNPNDDVSEFNRLNLICNVNNLNFDEMTQKSKIFVEEIKLLVEKLGYATSIEDINSLIKEYLSKKHSLSDNEKVGYLKLLFYLCELYNLNLRSLITNTSSKESPKSNDTSENPLNNQELLLNLIKERYENGSFNIEDFNPNHQLITEEDYNYLEELSNLAYNLFQIFIDKFNNYAYEDLNPIYSNMITEADITRLNSLTEEDILNILKLEEKHESTHYICKRFKLPENLYNFINKAIYETIDLKSSSIGISSKILFNVINTNNNISIYLNGPDKTIITILKKYIKKCIDNNINYELDGLIYNNNTYKVVIYSNKKDFKTKITILDNIISKEEIKNNLTNPLPFSHHQKNNLYSISRRNIINKKEQIPYIEYTNNLLEVAYYRVISKLIINLIDNEKDKNIVSNIIELQKVKCDTLNPQEININNVSFINIKDTINNYIPFINNTLSKYISDTEYQENIIEEFKKAIIYISNIIEGKDKKVLRNITVE